MISMDKKYKYRNGEPARILCVDSGSSSMPVISTNSRGEVTLHNTNGWVFSLGVDSDWDLIECPKYDGFRDGDEVVCWYDNILFSTVKRYFAYEKDGEAWCYANGQSKWTSDGTLTAWKNCMLASEFDGD